MKQYKAALAALGVAAVLTLAVGAAPATAHPLDNTDPGAGCATGSQVIKTTPIVSDFTSAQIGTMEVRYSPSCGTNWVRVNNSIGYNAHKSIFIVGGASDDADDWGPGWSYGMQIYAPGSTCVYVSAQIDDGDTVLGQTGNIQICG
jgi:hypothetical protein